jgi:hypothetical protein
VIAAFLYLLLYLAAGSAGLPIGWRLFGRSNPTGWVAGAIVGYAITALAIWVPIRMGFPSAFAFVAAWAVASLVTWTAVAWRAGPLFPAAPWQRADTAALASVLLLTAVIVIPPFLKLGSSDAAGNRFYRAYFTADFVWHAALTAEVGKFAMPPRNPFLRNRAIHYYWTYFLVPAAVSSTGPAPLRDVERCLKLNAILSGLLFMSMIFVSVRAAVPASGAAAVAVALALVASSAEGWAQIFRLASAGRSLAGVLDSNIDAVSHWFWGGYRVDGLQRAMWYNPQHSMSGALGLVALTAAALGGTGSSRTAGLMAGAPLAGSVAMNPFVGAVFAAAYGAGALAEAVRLRSIRRAVNSAFAAAPVALALAWCVSNQMADGAGGALEFGFGGPSRNAPLLTFLVSLGPAVIPAIAGLFVRSAAPFTSMIPAVSLATIAVVLMFFVRLSVDEAWVGFRTGHLLLMSLPALTANLFAWAGRSAPATGIATAAAVAMAGAPTLLIDAYNAQDISNLRPGPGFPWTRVVSPAQQAAFRWIREQTPPDATVQEDGLARHPTSWWVVPTFGHRRMAAGLPPFLLNVPEYMEKSERVRALYATHDAAEAAAIARQLRIDFVYLDDVDREASPNGVSKFQDERYFQPVFRNAAAAIYRVR